MEMLLSDFLIKYSVVGDITAANVALLSLFLMFIIHTTDTKTTKLFRMILWEVVIVSWVRLVFYLAAKHLAMLQAPSSALCLAVVILQFVYRCLILLTLYTFILYLMQHLHIDPGIERGHTIFLGCVTVAMCIPMLVQLIKGTGFTVTWQPEANSYYVSENHFYFVIGYCVLLFFNAFMFTWYRRRLYQQIAVTVCISGAFGALLFFVQSAFNTISFTTVSFIFPIFSFLYLLHSNPYDTEVGTLGAKEFSKHLSNSKTDHLVVEIYFHAIEKGHEEYPEELRSTLRMTFAKHFRHVLLFQLSNGALMLTTPVTESWQPHLNAFFESVSLISASHHLDFKGIALVTNENLRERTDIVNIIKFIGHQTDENDTHVITHDEMLEYQNQKRLIVALEAIASNNDLDDERVVVYCQPVWNVKKNRYDTGEALMRLRLGDEIIPPTVFIPLAEKIGAVNVLGKIILHKVCKQVYNLLDAGYDIERISVNFTVSDFRKPTFCEDVLGTIASAGIPCETIAIEMTETQNEGDFFAVKEKMNYLRHYGIKFYLDDFGTGYSNYERIMELPFDIVKFDRSLVLASAASVKSDKMVANMANMFRDTDYSVLFEGVETEEDIQRCLGKGAEYLQGFYYSAPIPIEEMSLLLEKKSADGDSSNE